MCVCVVEGRLLRNCQLREFNDKRVDGVDRSGVHVVLAHLLVHVVDERVSRLGAEHVIVLVVLQWCGVVWCSVWCVGWEVWRGVWMCGGVVVQ